MSTIDLHQALSDLGLNQLEAEVYGRLLTGEPATAYRVAQDLAKPAANVYKAVEALGRKGAVLVEDGESRICRAVPLDSFLQRAERDFQATVREARSALAHLHEPPADERVYRIDSVAQVLETCRDMLESRARKIAVIDAFPGALAAVRDSAMAAVERGVEVVVEAYHGIDLPGASVAIASTTTRAPKSWRSEQLNVVIDGQEHLLALLSADLKTLYQAVWSRSIYLSCLHHAGRLSEHTLIRMLAALENGRSETEVLEILRAHRFFQRGGVPGYEELIRRYAQEPSGPHEGSRRRRK